MNCCGGYRGSLLGAPGQSEAGVVSPGLEITLSPDVRAPPPRPRSTSSPGVEETPEKGEVLSPEAVRTTLETVEAVLSDQGATAEETEVGQADRGGFQPELNQDSFSFQDDVWTHDREREPEPARPQRVSVSHGPTDHGSEITDHAEALALLAEKICAEINGCLSQHGFPPLTTEKATTLSGQIQAAVSVENHFHKLIDSQIQTFLKNYLASSYQKSVPEPPGGLGAVQKELEDIAVKYVRLVNYNKMVYSPYHDAILGNVLKKEESHLPVQSEEV
uniref:Uncharacterized protein LOC117357209 n=1 Tax=Geotrypetes seraphini TaxID=260995 RepID=A0A6P8R484_GEOSA|nr:uncharacterized protein LOC117357209 [Geotrypetes seraphini]